MDSASTTSSPTNSSRELFQPMLSGVFQYNGAARLRISQSNRVDLRTNFADPGGSADLLSPIRRRISHPAHPRLAAARDLSRDGCPRLASLNNGCPRLASLKLRRTSGVS